MKEILVELQ